MFYKIVKQLEKRLYCFKKSLFSRFFFKFSSYYQIHIIGHQHPSSCIDSWSIVYYNIVNRYENIIVGQFFGHSHSDYFNVFYDLSNTTRATNVLYIGGSVTTYSNLNPAYRIYTVDGNYSASSFRVLGSLKKYVI